MQVMLDQPAAPCLRVQTLHTLITVVLSKRDFYFKGYPALKTALTKTKRSRGGVDFPLRGPTPDSLLRYLTLVSSSDDGCPVERLRSVRTHYFSILDGLARE